MQHWLGLTQSAALLPCTTAGCLGIGLFSTKGTATAAAWPDLIDAGDVQVCSAEGSPEALLELASGAVPPGSTTAQAAHLTGIV
jgi:hypothetical protein